MAGLSGNQSVAQVLAKNLSNLMDSERVASSYTAFVDNQQSDKTAVIGPIKITLNKSDDETKVGELTDTGTESSIYVPTPPEDIKRSTAEEKEQAFAKMHADIEYLENVKKVEQVYVQDREFGTYENNLTGQTVNREAELIFAKQNKIRDAVNEELVQKHNDSLKPTYSSGDEGLARQLEGRTYGVDGDLNVVTPGYETSFIDETGDKYGQSEQNKIGLSDQILKTNQLIAQQDAKNLMREMKADNAKQNKFNTFNSRDQRTSTQINQANYVAGISARNDFWQEYYGHKAATN
jgi:hypothetical protein